MDILKDVTYLQNPNFDAKNIELLEISIGTKLNQIDTNFDTSKVYGNWLHTDQNIQFKLGGADQDEVVGFLIRNEALGFKISRERKILKLFGKPQGKESDGGMTKYFYPDKNIVISWRNSKDRLFGIYLGDHGIEQTKYGIADFFEMFFKFKAMTPNYLEWNEKSLKSNEPRHIRYLQLIALMKAFNIGTDLKNDFDQLGFLQNKNLDDLEPIRKDIYKYIELHDFERDRFEREEKRINNPEQYQMIISYLFDLIERTRSLLHFNGGWLEAGTINARYMIYRTQKFLNSIDLQYLEEIKGLLYKVVDPDSKSFTQTELVENFEFPDVDLSSIDIDWT